MHILAVADVDFLLKWHGTVGILDLGSWNLEYCSGSQLETSDVQLCVQLWECAMTTLCSGTVGKVSYTMVFKFCVLRLLCAIWCERGENTDREQ